MTLKEQSGRQVRVLVVWVIMLAAVIGSIAAALGLQSGMKNTERGYYTASVKEAFVSQDKEIRAEGIYADLEEIPEELLKQVHTDTEQAIAKEYYVLTNWSMAQEWKNKAVYFLISPDGKENRLYDVYEAIFTNGEKQQTVYAAYVYKNVGRENLKPYNMGRMVFLDGNRQEVITGMLSVDVLYASELDRMMEKGWSFTASVSGNY
jgi:hypothetical protein